jgi:hypothetical protein
VRRRIGIIRDGVYYAAGTEPPVAPSRGAPMVIADGLADVLNPADGKRYDSKRAYYRAVRAAGAEIVGNEKQTQRPPDSAPVRPDIIEAMKRHGAL